MKMQVSVPPRSNEPDDSESLPFGPRTHKGAVLKLAMQELSLSGDLLPVGARLLVRHTFVSAERIPMEVVYAFMLPRDAALRRFRIEGKGFSVKSKLLPTTEAKRFYEDGIMEGHLSSLAQVYRDGMVNLTVGNIRPGEQVSVIMEILAGVELRDDSLRFRFPFTLAPAYHPKARMSLTADRSGEIQLPEDEFGDLILPPFRPDADKLHRIGFDLKVFAPAGLSELGSPSHAIHVSEINGTAARVQLALDHDVPNRDLVLEARFKTNYTGILVGTGKGSKRPFVGIVSSQAFGRTQVRPPRQVVFLLDRSGSMEGEPITQARNAILACLGALRATDRIGLVAFVRADNPFQGEVGDRVIISVDTLGSSRVFARLRESTVAPYDLVIFDEAHKLAADRGNDLRVRPTDR